MAEMTAVGAACAAPREHRAASILAAAEFERIADQLHALAPADWAQPTACGWWDVRAVAAHVLGMAEAQASARQFARDFRAARNRSGGKMIDEMTATHVRDRAAMTPDAIIRRLAAIAPRAVRARRPIRGTVRPVVGLKDVDPFDNGRGHRDHLAETVYTRDTWMHRLDISRATGRRMDLTAGHDGRLVADVVAEWARRHGSPFTLTLTGPAGGRWETGDRGQQLELDALDFCWDLAARRPGPGLMAPSVRY